MSNLKFKSKKNYKYYIIFMICMLKYNVTENFVISEKDHAKCHFKNHHQQHPWPT